MLDSSGLTGSFYAGTRLDGTGRLISLYSFRAFVSDESCCVRTDCHRRLDRKIDLPLAVISRFSQLNFVTRYFTKCGGTCMKLYDIRDRRSG